MTNLTRRSFLKQTSVSTATLGLLPCLPALAAMPDSPQATTPGVAASPFSGPIIVHVSDLAALLPFREQCMKCRSGSKLLLRI